MKSVWILEKWITPEEMQKGLKDFEALVADQTDIDREKMEEIVQKQKQLIADNPEGRWSGWEGKSIYRQFCEVAKDALRRSKKGDKFRVVKAEIEDSAKYWAGYVNPQENEGVMRYLWATK